MENNTMKEVVETLLEKQKEQLEGLQAKNMIELSSVKDELIENSNSLKTEVEGLKNELEDVETKLKKQMLNANTEPINNTVEKVLNSKDYMDSVVANVTAGKSFDYAFSMKLVRNSVHQPTNFTDGAAPVVLPFRELGVDKAPVRPPLVSDLIQWGMTNSNMVDWIERTGKTDAAAPRDEDALMQEGNLEYTEVSTKVKIMSEYMKVTKEALKDVSFLSSEINTELLSDIKLLVDDQILAGNGTGANLKGIMEYATDWVAGNFAASIVDPNYADVLRVGINQILTDGKMKWFPTGILMHPDDVTALDMLKIADGRYIDIPYYDGEKQTVVRVPIYMNTGITKGQFLIADFSKAKAFVRDELTIRVYDQNEDDAIRNRATVTANIRLAFRIKNQEAKAFVKGDFTTAIAALAKA